MVQFQYHASKIFYGYVLMMKVNLLTLFSHNFPILGKSPVLLLLFESEGKHDNHDLLML